MKPLSWRLPPLRNAALIIKILTGSFFEDTVRTIHESGVNPNNFRATVSGIRKTRGGDVIVNLEKISGASVLVAASGSKVDMEMVDLESTSTVEAVLAAVKCAFTVSSKGDTSIQTAANEITTTSMWRLKNGQQVAKLSVPREAKPTDEGVAMAKTNFTVARKNLRREIRKSKEQGWRDLCSQIDTNPWGTAYKLVMKKFSDGSTRLASKGREQAIADHQFPAAPITNWDTMPSPSIRNISDNVDPRRKARGPSGIPNEILKRIVLAQPRATLNIYNKCLSELTFPSIWKKAKLVLLHKGPDKPVEAPSSFRPICLLDTPGKLLERLIFQRLESHLDSRRTGRAPNQFGFRKGISTETALEVVTGLATHAAEEALRPDYIVLMIRSWLSDRKLLVGEQMASKTVTCRVPQGSVLGRNLWNVAYDYLLDMEVPQGAQLVSFADYLAVVEVAKTSKLLENLLNLVLAKIDDWMTTRGFQLAHHKTEAVMLTKKWPYNPPQLGIGSI
ncbi:hypothetical protein QTP88_003225 [Uroleucon formosanum]